MARKKEIEFGKVEKGVMEITLSHWKHFPKLVTRDLLDYPGYIFRGQSNFEWKIESSFDRLIRNKEDAHEDPLLHLNAFKNAAKGRRGKNPEILKSDNEWWALAQHYGLATPLLDFTRSVFVALYFAFWDESFDGENRIVCAVQGQNLKDRMTKIKDETKRIDLFYPSSETNDRLVNQSGLFLKMPVTKDLEEIVKENFNKKDDGGILLKIKIPNKDIKDCLVMLNKMNINHSTLFPDLFGAAKFVNCMIDKPIYDSLRFLNME